MNNPDSFDRKIDSLLWRAANDEDILKLVGLIRWDSQILYDIPSISPVCIGQTYNLRNIISSPFGARFHPIFHQNHFHAGIDIPGREKDTVFVPANGIVLEIGRDPKLGGYIKVRHKYDLVSIYGHLRKTFVMAGDTISIGTPIGLIGNTGNSTGAHLHYTLKHRGRIVDPIPFCYLMFEYLNRFKINESLDIY